MRPDSAEGGRRSFALETLLDLPLPSFGWTQSASFWLQPDYHCKYSAFLSSMAHSSELWKLRRYCVSCSQLIRRLGGLGAPEFTAADGSEGSFMQDDALSCEGWLNSGPLVSEVIASSSAKSPKWDHAWHTWETAEGPRWLGERWLKSYIYESDW